MRLSLSVELFWHLPTIGVMVLGAVCWASAENRMVEVAAFERLGRHGVLAPEMAGRLLVSELSCTACHATEDRATVAKGGPDLSGVGLRLDQTWVGEFIANPSASKPGTTMPEMLHGLAEPQRTAVARSLAMYLATLRKPFAEVKGSGLHPVPHQFWDRGDATQGRLIYHRVGCVACHAADAAHEIAEVASSPTDQLLEMLDEDELAELGLAGASRPGPVQSLGRPAAKYTARSLTQFLLDPDSIRPSGRMPHLKLTPTEAADIAAYLIQMRSSDDQRERPEPNDQPDQSLSVSPDATSVAEAPGDVTREIAEGRRWFVELRCGNCHTGADSVATELAKSQAAAKPMAVIAAGLAASTSCLQPSGGEAAGGGQPRYLVDSAQSEAMAAALLSVQPLDVEEKLRLSMLQLNCFACHQRDEIGGVARDRRPYFETVGNEDLGDEGRFPPPLSQAEQKLTPAWLTRVLQGTATIRPHMEVRMPKLPAEQVTRLATGFEAVYQANLAGKASVTDLSSDEGAGWPNSVAIKATEVGRAMMDVGCVQCHLFRGESLPGVVGVDLLGIADRMRPQWFRELVRDPGAVKPRTRMPNFFPEGKSQSPELLDGDPDRQIAAMWGYLGNLAKLPLPAKIEEARAQDYELRPTDRPILLRTFMKQAGTHAIAVGFPQAVHFAFDSHQLRLAAAWRGRFLDAQGTWFVRAAPPADPLGESLIRLDSIDPFIVPIGDEPKSKVVEHARGVTTGFGGYRIDAEGVPTFLYRIGSLAIEDRIVPTSSVARDLQAMPESQSTEQRRGLDRQLRISWGSAAESGAAQTGQPAAEPRQPIGGSTHWYRLISGKKLLRTAAIDADSLVYFANESGLSVGVLSAVAQSAQLRSDGEVSSWIVPITRLDSDDDASSTSQLLELRYRW